VAPTDMALLVSAGVSLSGIVQPVASRVETVGSNGRLGIEGAADVLYLPSTVTLLWIARRALCAAGGGVSELGGAVRQIASRANARMDILASCGW